MTVQVPIIDDLIVEPTEDFEATLLNPGPKVLIGTNDVAFVDILDDDGRCFICESLLIQVQIENSCDKTQCGAINSRAIRLSLLQCRWYANYWHPHHHYEYTTEHHSSVKR